MKKFLPFLLILAACNSMYIKPDTIDKTKTVFAGRGGYSMTRSIKERMEERGYNVIVGVARTIYTVDITDDEWNDVRDFKGNKVPKEARYVVNVSERREKFFPTWCLFNGFWWWNFNVSIADQMTGEELLSWRGRGCANSSLRKLDAALDELEK
ncbi:MAG: hypothetical protein LBJ18_03775 [Rickettsiales bacterium]|jgi:hypothetical protein|nr:hypothetical protein [Rickettsiales bacterium]